MPTHPTPLPPVLKSRMLPRMSLGFLFVLTTTGALIAAIARSAGQGAELAVAALVALGYVAVCFGIFVGLFLVCRMVALIRGDRVDDGEAGSPFSADQLPPQIVAPREIPS